MSESISDVEDIRDTWFPSEDCTSRALFVESISAIRMAPTVSS